MKRTVLYIFLATTLGIIVAVSSITVFQSWQEQRIVIEAQESAQRQDSQHMREEMEALDQDAPSESSDESATVQTLVFSGTLLESSYQERASEVQAPTEAFPNASVLLLQLETPMSATGYSAGSNVAPTERMISVMRVPDNLGADGEHIAIEVDEPLYWPSDISGALWDLDLSGIQSIQVVSP